MIDPISSVVSGVMRGLDALFTSDEERAKAKATLESLRQQPHLMQAIINQKEASHKSLFVAGWRPFIGWICGFGLAYTFLGQPLLSSFGLHPVIFNSADLMTLVLSMLGLGGMRSFDKLKGTTITYGQNSVTLPVPRET